MSVPTLTGDPENIGTGCENQTHLDVNGDAGNVDTACECDSKNAYTGCEWPHCKC